MADSALRSGWRSVSIVSGVESDLFAVTSLVGREAVSELFEFEVVLLSEDGEIDFADIIGKQVSLKLELQGSASRHLNGLVCCFEQTAVDGMMFEYKATLVPWTWLLTRNVDHRIYQDMSTVDIIKDVFDRAGMKDFEPIDVQHGTDTIPYCVQYGESDFDFVSRLMEEAGIAYTFSHDDQRHMMVFFDDPAQNEPLPDSKVIEFENDLESAGDRPVIRTWSLGKQIHTGKVSLRSFDFEDPGLDLTVTQKTNNDIGENSGYEIYRYREGYTAIDAGDARAKLRMEAEEALGCRISATSRCVALTPGYRFDLEGHPRKSFDDTYLVTEVEHDLTQDVETGSTVMYSNRFVCIPHAVPFRPQRVTPKPRIHGAQTAVVVGTSDEEIDIDEHGRVVVQFHWDREGQNDEKSSCRIRVAQAWAGKGWGAVFHPRIGQEVIVEFLEGDPDRPIITGRLFNGAQKPHVNLPGDKTQSGIRSRSTKDGGAENYNEIRFEDKKGSELFVIQAEKNQETRVKNDESKEVGHDQTLDVSNNKTVTVGANHGESIGENQSVEVGKDRTDKVGGDESRDVGKDRIRGVTGKETVDIGKEQVISIGENRETTIGEDDNLQVGGSRAVNVGENQGVTVAKAHTLEAKTITLEAGDEIVFKTGSASIQMKKDGSIAIKGKKIQIKATGDLVMSGSKITQN